VQEYVRVEERPLDRFHFGYFNAHKTPAAVPQSTDEGKVPKIGFHIVPALPERNVKVAKVTYVFNLARALFTNLRDGGSCS
jgi:hypothetical protein